MRPLPVPTLEPEESNATASGASPTVGEALATATGAPDTVVVVVVPPPPGAGVQASATNAMNPSTGKNARRTFIFPPNAANAR